MTSYSGCRFYKDWVYAIEKDFHSSDGTPAEWASGQPQQYGDELASIPLASKPESASVNADETLIAIAVEHDIFLYSTDIKSLTQVQVLRGHLSEIDAVEFHPTKPNVLVSCAMGNHGSEEIDPQIILWNLDEQRERRLLSDELSQKLGLHAAESVAKRLNDKEIVSEQVHPWSMSLFDTEVLTKDFAKAITAQNVASEAEHSLKISGRLTCHFNSSVFNSTGTSLAFMPGMRPPSNGDEKWDVCIYDVPTNSVRLTLVGHRDAIMWIGFSPDDKYIATVCWDETFRIWSHATGELIHTFRSKGQNWTGAFSHDSRFFAGMSGERRFWVWDLAHGVEVISAPFVGSRSHWCRVIDWSPDDKLLAVGGGRSGNVVVFDVKRQEILQERVLSYEKSADELKKGRFGMIEMSFVRFVEDEGRYGRKVVMSSGADQAVEVYDFGENRKWRFAARQGVDKGWGGDTLVLEKKGLIVSVNEEAVRFWELPVKQAGL